MTDELKNALIIGVVGFAVMIIASIALWVFLLSEIVCSIVMVIGLVIVIVAIVYASKPDLIAPILEKLGIIKD